MVKDIIKLRVQTSLRVFHCLLDLRLFGFYLHISCHQDFKFFQIDVKSAFLNSYLKEKVYEVQPPEFID